MQIIKTEKFTENNTGIVMNIALNYGSREEIIHAVRGLVRDAVGGKVKLEDISEDMMSNRLYTGGIPDPDLIIRTSGEERLSNFLMWQSAYSELYFTRRLWPDFNINDLHTAIIAYQNRNRRYGGV